MLTSDVALSPAGLWACAARQLPPAATAGGNRRGMQRQPPTHPHPTLPHPHPVYTCRYLCSRTKTKCTASAYRHARRQLQRRRPAASAPHPAAAAAAAAGSRVRCQRGQLAVSPAGLLPRSSGGATRRHGRGPGQCSWPGLRWCTRPQQLRWCTRPQQQRCIQLRGRPGGCRHLRHPAARASSGGAAHTAPHALDPAALQAPPVHTGAAAAEPRCWRMRAAGNGPAARARPAPLAARPPAGPRSQAAIAPGAAPWPVVP